MGVKREIRLKMSTLGPTQAARSRRLRRETPVPTWMTRGAAGGSSGRASEIPSAPTPPPRLQSRGEGEETGTPQTLIILIIILDRMMVIDSARPLTR